MDQYGTDRAEAEAFDFVGPRLFESKSRREMRWDNDNYQFSNPQQMALVSTRAADPASEVVEIATELTKLQTDGLADKSDDCELRRILFKSICNGTEICRSRLLFSTPPQSRPNIRRRTLG